MEYVRDEFALECCANNSRSQTISKPRNNIRRAPKYPPPSNKMTLTAASSSLVYGHGADIPTLPRNKLFGWYCISGDVGPLTSRTIGLLLARWVTSSSFKLQHGSPSASLLRNTRNIRSTSRESGNSFQSLPRIFQGISAIRRLHQK